MIETYFPREIEREAKRAQFRQFFEDSRPYHYAEHRRQVRELCEREGTPLPIGGATTFNGVETLAELNSAVTVANTVTATSLVGGDDRGPYSPQYFSRIAAEFLVEAGGVCGDTTSAPTLLIRLCSGIAWNTTAVTTTPLCGTNNMTATAMATTSMANVDWYVRIFGVTRSVGGQSSTILATGYGLGLVFSSTQPFINIKNATPPTAVTVDLSVNVYLDLVATFGTANAANTITCNFYNLRSMN